MNGNGKQYAYYDTAAISDVKSFIEQALTPGAFTTTLFTAVISSAP